MIEWTHYDIYTDEDVDNMLSLYRATEVEATAFDTETTGLHIIYDTPFMFQFGWYSGNKGCTFVVDNTDMQFFLRVITFWQALVVSSPIDLGHNVKFDLHMCANIGIKIRRTNLSDTSFWIRLGTDNIPERKGGAPMRLKLFAAKYISLNAREHEKELEVERGKIAQQYNLALQAALNQTGKPPSKKYKSWTKGCLEDFFKDKTHEVDDLPEVFQPVYNTWFKTLPQYLQDKVTGFVEADMIRYDMLDRATVRKYGHKDIVWTLETYRALEPVVKGRGNLPTLQMENSGILNLFDMERVGFIADKQYLYDSKERVRMYIKQRRMDLHRMAGQELSISQSALIKEILFDRFDIEVSSTGADELDLLVVDLKRNNTNPEVVEFIATIQELRTLEKWYSTYIMRFIWEMKHGDRIYTTVNTTGTVSGRVTSDFQQFPKDAIEDVAGNELFCPRRMVLATSNQYKGIVYLDYSQIELRLQAMYTILVGHPDLNLCRAYMPYECYTKDQSGIIMFDYRNKLHRDCAYTWKWYVVGTDEVWTPTDVHGATTKHAFDITEDDEHYKKLRYVGKRVNFAKNYGAQLGKITAMFPEYTIEQCKKIDSAYYLAFPGVKMYHAYCEQIATSQAYATNLFGRRYYGVSGHNLKNMLVQGSGADFLKWKINQVCDYMRSNNMKSTFVMEIHDELQFYWDKRDDAIHFEKIKEIMEDWEDGLVPIVADMELTTTNWKEKFEVEDITCW